MEVCPIKTIQGLVPGVRGRLRSRGSLFEASPGKQLKRPHLQNNQSKVDWQCG
jgi:hypothetical protein